MKVCPRCQKTYADDNLNFCLEDGSVLQQFNEPPATVQMSAPQVSQQQAAAMPTQPGAQAGWNVPGQQQYSMQPTKRSSKAWIWVLLILGFVVLLCGGGFAGLMYVGMQQQQAEQANLAANNARRETNTTRGNSTANSNSGFSSTSERNDSETVDLSRWVRDFSVYGDTSYAEDEFFMSAKQKGYYYVLVAPEEYQTENANTRVTLRNVDNAPSTLGYGLIFHSNPTPLQQDYAFLIDTKRKKYRVVHHQPSKEGSVVSWTSSPAIKEGAEPNVLEARDLPDKIELYINGTMVTSIKNVHGYKGGVAGLYSGDGAKIGFKDLQISK